MDQRATQRKANENWHRWADRYLDLAAAKRTLQDDIFMLKVLPVEFGSLPLEEIIYAKIKAFALKLRQMPVRQDSDRLLSPATCNRKLALLRHIFRMAWQEGLIEKLPAVDRQEDNERDRVLIEEEFTALYEQAAAHLQPILFCAWETGMRRGEILSLTWHQVNLRENLISLESQDTKTKRRRLIPVSQKLRETFFSLRQALGKVTDIHQHVFLGATGKPVKNSQEAFDNAVDRAGLKDVHFHDLRRSFATRKVAEGWDRDYVKAITGHRTDKVFSRYNKPPLEMLQAVVEGAPSLSLSTSVGKRIWTLSLHRAKCLISLYGEGWGPVAPPVFKFDLRQPSNPLRLLANCCFLGEIPHFSFLFFSPHFSYFPIKVPRIFTTVTSSALSCPRSFPKARVLFRAP